MIFWRLALDQQGVKGNTPFSKQDAQRIISGLYRVILNRDPDRVGLEAHLGHFLSLDPENSFDITLKTFLDGDEAQRYRKEKFIQAGLQQTVSMYDPSIRNLDIISIGSHCYTSWILKQAGLKSASGPFDWLFSSVGMVRHCLDDNFQAFLDPRWFRPVPETERKVLSANKCDHLFYKNNFGIDYVFNHRDPTHAADHNYFLRCVERIRLLRNNDKVPVFLLTFRPFENWKDEVHLLSKSIEAYFQNSYFLAACIIENKSLMPVSKEVLKASRVSVYEFHSMSDWQDLQFDNALDDFMLFNSILKSISSSVR